MMEMTLRDTLQSGHATTYLTLTTPRDPVRADVFKHFEFTDKAYQGFCPKAHGEGPVYLTHRTRNCSKGNSREGDNQWDYLPSTP